MCAQVLAVEKDTRKRKTSTTRAASNSAKKTVTDSNNDNDNDDISISSRKETKEEKSLGKQPWKLAIKGAGASIAKNTSGFISQHGSSSNGNVAGIESAEGSPQGNDDNDDESNREISTSAQVL